MQGTNKKTMFPDRINTSHYKKRNNPQNKQCRGHLHFDIAPNLCVLKITGIKWIAK